MKKIEAIIRPEKLETVVDKLSQLGYSGLHYTEIQGHGRQKGIKEVFRGREYDVHYIPKIKIEIITIDEQAEKIIETIVNTAQTGQIGDGKIFVSEITDVIRIRTKERGEQAV
jgi:nitrogen regulatory protein P-II 1